MAYHMKEDRPLSYIPFAQQYTYTWCTGPQSIPLHCYMMNLPAYTSLQVCIYLLGL